MGNGLTIRLMSRREARKMLLIDVITNALPALTGLHATDSRRASQGIGPNVGLAWFHSAAGIHDPQRTFEYPNWPSFGSQTLGIIGMNAIGLALARDAFATARANIIYHHAERVAEAESACAARLVGLGTVLLADAIFVTLPWADRAEGLLRTLEFDR